MQVDLLIENGDMIYAPVLVDGLEMEWDRKGAPGKLTFAVMEDDALQMALGNQVRVTVGGENLFFGYLFDIKRDKSRQTTVTVYDQLRYLKNKDTYVYESKTATQIVRMIAEDFLLNVGTLADTGHVIASRVEDNKTLFDIIQNTLDLTLTSTGRLYVLYDDAGTLTLRDVEAMQLPILIDGETGENFEYVASIDEDTYNQIKLVYEDKESGSRKIYMSRDSGTIETWGVLQYYEKLDNEENGQSMADGLLALRNRATRTLTINGACGDPRVRAGSSVMVRMDLRDMTVGNMMMVEHVRHIFNGDDHRMDLELRGDVIGT